MPDEASHMDRRNTTWSFNKEINISTVFFLLTQTVAVVIFIVKMDARISNLEERRIEDRAATQAMAQVPERLLRTEFELANMKAGFSRLEGKIDQQQLQLDQKRQSLAPHGNGR